MTLKEFVDKLCAEYNVQYRIRNRECYLYGENRFVVAGLLASLVFQYGVTCGFEAEAVFTMEGEPDD